MMSEDRSGEREEGQRKLRERILARTLLVGGCVGSLGGLSGGIAGLWQGHPRVWRNVLFTGTTLLVLSSGTTFLTEVYREHRRQGKASLVDSFVAGALFGFVIAGGSLRVRGGPQLLATSLYLGGASAVIDYCMLKLVTPDRLKREQQVESPPNILESTPPSIAKESSWWGWLPVVGHRARRIDKVQGEIEELQKEMQGLKK